MTDRRLRDYEPIVGAPVIDEIAALAERLRGVRVQNVNTTAVGGGVAEILHRMIPLLRELGVEATWDVMKGGEAFFQVTKAFHNALHGAPGSLTPAMKEVYLETTARNLRELPVTGDVVFIHDPQPAGLVQARRGGGARWLWRCHIDLSAPNPEFWNFLQPYVEQYDASVFSAPAFAQRLRIPQFLIAPSIDPLSDKNRDLPREQVRVTLERHGIDPGRPVVTQVSRFDRLKDPVGVVDAYRLVRKHQDCQLVLAGGTADDDPEGAQVLAEVRERAGKDPDIHILLLPPDAHLEINALQRGSTVVVQKSVREGFGLTVAEALWKGRPVVAGAVGGIPQQIQHRVTGLLVRSPEGAAQAIKQVLANPDFAHELGEYGREHVRQNFLLTRHLTDYLCAFLAVRQGGDGAVYL
jgi:trehalose synthase